MSEQSDGWFPYRGTPFGYSARQHCWMQDGRVLSEEEAEKMWASFPVQDDEHPLTLQTEPGETTEHIYPDLDSAQEALDRGETVRIAMEPFEIDPALAEMAQRLQDKESLIAFFGRLGEGMES